jgi:hypothetical protein
MRIKEIIQEDISAEDQLGGSEGKGTLIANLLPVLMFLKKRSEDKGLSPKLRTDSLIQLVQNAGDNTFSYEDLVAAYEDNDAVHDIIKDFNEDEIIIKTTHDDTSELKHDADEQDKAPEDTEKIVSNMAKSAARNRS